MYPLGSLPIQPQPSTFSKSMSASHIAACTMVSKIQLFHIVDAIRRLRTVCNSSNICSNVTGPFHNPTSSKQQRSTIYSKRTSRERFHKLVEGKTTYYMGVHQKLGIQGLGENIALSSPTFLLFIQSLSTPMLRMMMTSSPTTLNLSNRGSMCFLSLGI
jgi:hypothetical protein